jgi:ACS family hexuronate transporter-like MFS transporter
MKPFAEPSRTETVPAADGWYARNWRWWVLGTLFLATFLNYFDRQTLSVAIEPISQEFGLGSVERGKLLAAFVYAYAFAHLFIGFVIDRVRNLRWFFPAMVLGWSLSTVLVGLAERYTHILYLRYALGVFEAANFPLCLLLIARVFPPHQRSLAAGIFNSGAVFATLAAPKLVIYFSTNYTWRYSFFVTGALGVLWLVPWLLIFRDEKVPASAPVAARGEFEPSTRLFGPGFWSIAAIGVGLLPGWYFMSQWLPSYLTQSLGLAYDQALGNRLTLIYFTQDLGLWLGGGAVWWFTRRGFSVLRSRKMVIVAGYVLMMSILLLPRLESVGAVLAVLCVYVFGLAAWQANQQAFKQDVSPARVATVAALVGFAETVSSAFLVEKVGEVVQRTGGFNAIFGLLAVCFTGSLVVLLILKKKWLQIQ